MKGKFVTIDKLAPGESAVVDHVEPSPLSERLRELGLVSGTRVSCLHRSPFGDPSAYCIRGAVIAIRREDGRHVLALREGIRNG